MRIRVWAAGNMSANIAPHLGALKLRPWLMGVAGAMMIPFFASVVYFLARMMRTSANRPDDPNEIAGTLSQLKNLHDSGDLSDAEYNRQRDRVLTPA